MVFHQTELVNYLSSIGYYHFLKNKPQDGFYRSISVVQRKISDLADFRDSSGAWSQPEAIDEALDELLAILKAAEEDLDAMMLPIQRKAFHRDLLLLRGSYQSCANNLTPSRELLQKHFEATILGVDYAYGRLRPGSDTPESFQKVAELRDELFAEWSSPLLKRYLKAVDKARNEPNYPQWRAEFESHSTYRTLLGEATVEELKGDLEVEQLWLEHTK